MARWHVAPEAVEPGWWETSKYLPLLRADCRLWAWEWLRRNVHHQTGVAHISRSAQWISISPTRYRLISHGLDELLSEGAFAHVSVLGVSEHPKIFWAPAIDPSVVSVHADAISGTHVDAFDFGKFEAMGHLVIDVHRREMLVLGAGDRQIQLAVTSGTLLEGPVRLHYQLDGFDQVDLKLRTIARLSSLRRLGRFPTSLFPHERRAAKWIKALQAYDGVAAGASHREIATALYGEKSVREDWSGRSDFLRLRIQRLLNYARGMVDGGYRHLLG